MCIDYRGLMPPLMQCNMEEKLQHEAELLQAAHRGLVSTEGYQTLLLCFTFTAGEIGS